MKRLLLLLMTASLLLAPAACKKGNPKVEIQTPEGMILVELFEDQAPVTVGNFLKHVKNGVYDGASFYRVVRGTNDKNPVSISVLQGGVRDKTESGPFDPIELETTLQTGVRHLEGTLSMARDKPGSARTEFFICIRDEPELDYGGLRNPDGLGFAAFGRVIGGHMTVNKIYQGRAAGQELAPPVRIHSMRIQ